MKKVIVVGYIKRRKFVGYYDGEFFHSSDGAIVAENSIIKAEEIKGSADEKLEQLDLFDE